MENKQTKTEDQNSVASMGQKTARAFLTRSGYEILEEDWQCEAGSADVIAREENAIVFFEVSTRYGAEKGLPAENISAKKRDRYERIAAAYLTQNEFPDDNLRIRFDIISITVLSNSRAMIRHHVNAWGTIDD